MTKHCINHARVIYDCCRSCHGKDADCPEYLSDIEHTRKERIAEEFPLNQQNIPLSEGNYKDKGEVREICKPQPLCSSETSYRPVEFKSYREKNHER